MVATLPSQRTTPTYVSTSRTRGNCTPARPFHWSPRITPPNSSPKPPPSRRLVGGRRIGGCDGIEFCRSQRRIALGDLGVEDGPASPRGRSGRESGGESRGPARSRRTPALSGRTAGHPEPTPLSARQAGCRIPGIRIRGALELRPSLGGGLPVPSPKRLDSRGFLLTTTTSFASSLGPTS